MTKDKEFSLIEKNETKSPHKFIAFKYHTDDEDSFSETAQTCLQAWRITADIYKNKIVDTDFKDDNISDVVTALNALGRSRLPETPIEDSDITKNPYITDITEIISMNLIGKEFSDITIPYPRVLHKEAVGNQHKGIDLIGYIETQAGHILLIIEVMASVEDKYPAATVRQHFTQLMDQTLKNNNDRLIKELVYIHDEADDSFKDIINGFLVATYTKEFNNKEDVLAVPVMVRPINKWHNNDWKPFLTATQEFEQANIPSTVCYYAIECDCNFSELLDHIKRVV